MTEITQIVLHFTASDLLTQDTLLQRPSLHLMSVNRKVQPNLPIIKTLFMFGGQGGWFGKSLSSYNASAKLMMKSRRSSPGRFYYAAMMKTMSAKILLKYDFELLDRHSRRWWTWRSSMLPKENTVVIFRDRRTEVD